MRYRIQILLLLISLFTVQGALSAREDSKDLRSEMGFWIGASNPLPGTATDEVLDSTIGGGLFYRVKWPWILHTEFGMSYSNYLSRTTQSLTIAPFYAALSYRLPLTFQLQVFLKFGGGATWVVVRPQNRQGWDPLLFSGLEFSIRAGRKLRIGLRFDYNLVYEEHKDPPPETTLLKYYGNRDPRYSSQREFTISNGKFFHFGLMLSFFL